MMSIIFSILAGLLCLYIFALLPFSLLWTIGSKDILTCKRLLSGRTICQHKTWRLLGLRHQAAEWQLQGARVMESSEGMGGVTYSLSLTTNKREVNLPYYSGNREQAYQDFDRLREFLKGSSQSSFYLERSYSLFTNLLLFIVAVIIFMNSLVIIDWLIQSWT